MPSLDQNHTGWMRDRGMTKSHNRGRTPLTPFPLGRNWTMPAGERTRPASVDWREGHRPALAHFPSTRRSRFWRKVGQLTWVGFLTVMLSWLTACSPPAPESRSTPSEIPSATPGVPPSAIASPTAEPDPDPPAALITRLQTVLNQEFGIPVSDIVLQSATAVTWPDSCLGVNRPDELCAQVLTPGYRIRFTTPTAAYEFHTDRSGNTYRLVDGATDDSSTNDGNTDDSTEES